MPTIGLLGAGLMGSAIGRRLLEIGCDVVVWNRTASRAEPLVQAGAVLADTPVEAMQKAELVIAVTATTAEVEHAVAQAGDALAGKDFVNLVTATPSETRELGASVTAAGAAYLSGTIQCYPSMIGKANSVIIYGGDSSLWERRASELSGLAGGSYLAGSDVGRPNVIDSSVTAAFLFTSTAASLEAARYALADGMTMAEFREVLDTYLKYLPLEIDKVLTQVEREEFGSKEATLEIYTRSLEMFTRAFADAEAPSHIMSGNLHRMRQAVAAGDGDLGFAALYRH